MWFNNIMSVKFNLDEKTGYNSQNKVKVTDLLNRLNQEKKIEKKKKFSSRCCCSFCSNSFWHYFNYLIYHIFIKV